MPQFKDVPDASQITMANVNHARHQVPETTAGTRNIYNENKSGKNKSGSTLDPVPPPFFTPLKCLVNILMFLEGWDGWRG